MARYTGPKCRLCRREGVKLFLKGARCESEKCAITRRHQAPGQKGNPRKRKASGYSLQLREKQKVKRIYGILEKQFGNYMKKALNEKEVTGQALMKLLETRLDNVVYRVGMVASRAQARQFIRFGYFKVNGKLVTIPSYQVSAGDIIEAANKEKISAKEMIKIPDWLKFDSEALKVEILEPKEEESFRDSDLEINTQLIVEYYSR